MISIVEVLSLYPLSESMLILGWIVPVITRASFSMSLPLLSSMPPKPDPTSSNKCQMPLPPPIVTHTPSCSFSLVHVPCDSNTSQHEPFLDDHCVTLSLMLLNPCLLNLGYMTRMFLVVFGPFAFC